MLGQNAVTVRNVNMRTPLALPMPGLRAALAVVRETSAQDPWLPQVEVAMNAHSEKNDPLQSGRGDAPAAAVVAPSIHAVNALGMRAPLLSRRTNNWPLPVISAFPVVQLRSSLMIAEKHRVTDQRRINEVPLIRTHAFTLLVLHSSSRAVTLVMSQRVSVK